MCLEAVAAGTVREALEVWEDWRPDVLVSDISRGEDGYDLIRAISTREGPNGVHTPAIALTGYAGLEDGERALSAGYGIDLAKSVDPAEPRSAIARLARVNGWVFETQ